MRSHIKKTEKGEKNITNRAKEIINIKVEINKIESRKMVKKIKQKYIPFWEGHKVSQSPVNLFWLWSLK